MRRDLESHLENIAGIISGASGEIYVASHPSADPDSISSLIALSHLVKSIGSETQPKFIAVNGVASNAAKLLEVGEESDLYSVIDYTPQRGDLLVVLDAPDCGRASISCDVYEHVYIIDHHALNGDPARYGGGRTHVLRDEYYTSTTEIVVQLLKILGERTPVELDRGISTAILAGLLYDTRVLQHPSIIALDSAQYLMMHGASIGDALRLIQTEMGLDEKIARVKGIMRARAYRVNGYIVCISHVGAHESSLAQLLAAAGCDLAVVLSDKEDHLRISLRCSQNLCRDEVDLESMLLKKLSSTVGARYGGHRRAAVASTPKLPMGEVESRIISILESFFGSDLKPLKP